MPRQRKLRTVSDQLRDAIMADERTVYRLWKDSGIDQITIGRFIRKERDIRMATADKLCTALGLELQPKEIK